MLTDAGVRNAKPREKAFKLSDERGLYLLVDPSGSKLWRLKYRFANKEKKLALGIYPEVTLTEVLEYRVEWIEMQLAHEVKDPNGRAYDRTAFLEGRAKMMQGWADYAGHHTERAESPAEIIAGVLTAAVGVKQRAGWRRFEMAGIAQRIEHQLIGHTIAEAVAERLAWRASRAIGASTSCC